MIEILKKIVDKREERIKKIGVTFGYTIPDKRCVPLVIPDFENGAIICEVKRGSPSEGKMNKIENPVEWVSNYVDGGANTISVLTEEDFFYGSINDLIKIKNSYPKISVLRKDFLLYEEEVEISYKIGADMILLIAAILDFETLKKMKEKAESFGIVPLIEVHNEDELNKIFPLKPKLIGINSRNLNTFKIDKNYPFALNELIRIDNKTNNYKSHVIFESGIKNNLDSFFVGNADFNGILVGTSIVKSGDVTNQIKSLKNGFENGILNKSTFYDKIFYKHYIEKKVIVKICGITNIDDAIYCIEKGVDILGFIFADSKREISIKDAKNILSQIGDKVLKIGVVVDKNIEDVAKLVKDGFLDAIQFHNDFSDSECQKYGVCYYKAVRVKDRDDIDAFYYSPITLFDAFSIEAHGGTGKQIDKELLDYAKSKEIKLALAGGITPFNIKEILESYNPFMVDISSGVEKSYGKKDFKKIDKIMDECKNVSCIK
ncbi:MAG TPA: bifunctional indole-3-glycerol phosphate synthase/phosphoribosylanthranilate isomerase [Spirochaetota bacterium]|nr:bifunctional indole-3-glycerol phosphate synthase/phosphoribosylanthranilate isomerase [Spirochaetota bacterium]